MADPGGASIQQGDGEGDEAAAGSEARGELLAAALDRMPIAVVLTDGDGAIVHANDAGTRLLAGREWLAAIGGRLAVVAKGSAKLAAALAAALGPDAPLDASIMEQRNGRDGCLFTIAPLRSSGQPGSGVMLTMQEMPRGERRLQGRLGQIFGLTPAEEDIAIGIAEGRTLRQIALDRQVAEMTVRGQLKTLGRKLGCHRQAEIAALLRSILPMTNGCRD